MLWSILNVVDVQVDVFVFVLNVQMWQKEYLVNNKKHSTFAAQKKDCCFRDLSFVRQAFAVEGVKVQSCVIVWYTVVVGLGKLVENAKIPTQSEIYEISRRRRPAGVMKHRAAAGQRQKV